MATYGTVYFPIPAGALAAAAPMTHFTAEAWSDGFLQGVGLRMWMSTNSFEPIQKMAWDACGLMVFCEPSGEYVLKEGDYLDFDLVNFDSGPFEGLDEESLMALVDDMLARGEVGPELARRVAPLLPEERFGAAARKHGFGEMNSRMWSVADGASAGFLDAPVWSVETLLARLREVAGVEGLAAGLRKLDMNRCSSTQHAWFGGKLHSLTSRYDGLVEEGEAWVPTGMLAALYCDGDGWVESGLERGIGEADWADLDALAEAFPEYCLFGGSEGVRALQEARAISKVARAGRIASKPKGL